MILLIIFSALLVASSTSSPVNLKSRAASQVVQGVLGTDEYWNVRDGGLNSYTQYAGNGSSAAGWPSRLQWISFNDMWTINQHVMSRSCEHIYDAPNNSPNEIQALFNAIQTVSKETRVDHRFILAAIMQETKGCVRAKTTISPDGTVRNPGILQDHEGTHSCNENGKVQTPCPNDQITGMVRDGVAGTAKGDGFGFAANIATQTDVKNIEFAQAYYRAARLYNSGVIDESGDLGKGNSATHCYSSDIANRMVGWVDAESKCTLDEDSA